MNRELPLPKERLEQIASIFGKPTLPGEAQIMAQLILAAYGQEPFGFVARECVEHMHDDDKSNWMWSISGVVSVVRGVDKFKHEVPVYLHPVPAPVIVADLSEQEIEAFRKELESGPTGEIFVSPRLPGKNTLRQNRDLVMMVKVLVREVRRFSRDSQRAKDALEYLQREGLISTADILRDGAKDSE